MPQKKLTLFGLCGGQRVAACPGMVQKAFRLHHGWPIARDKPVKIEAGAVHMCRIASTPTEVPASTFDG